jgi:acetolactate synthase-1/2/3 large subunit
MDRGIREALSINGPVVIDVPTYQFENCYPMIPAGGSNHEMLLEDPPDLKKPQAMQKTGSQADSDTVVTA